MLIQVFTVCDMFYLYLTVLLACSLVHPRFFFLFIGLICLGVLRLQAQPLPGDEQLHLARYQSDTAYRQKTDALETYTYHRQLAASLPSSRSILTVPVVVHIMHPAGSVTPGSPGNPTNEQVEVGMRWLNEAFRNQGAYAGGPFYTDATLYGVQAVDTEIEFCLAQIAPDGTPSTGITRTATAFTQVAFNQVVTGTATEDQLMKAEAFWDANQYLNLWIVSSICEYDNINCDIAGYAYLPGAHGTSLDGVVIEGDYFGTTASATATAVYYFARYLNLWRTSYHDLSRPKCDNDNCAVRGDRVCDTPPDSTLGGPATCGVMQNSCDADSAHADPILNPFYGVDVSDMYENFMDLGDTPTCQNTFTPGQKARMRAALQTTRQSLLGQNLCTVPTLLLALEAWEAPEVLSCEQAPAPRVRIRNQGNLPVTDIRLKCTWNGQADTLTWQGNLLPGAALSLDLNAQVLSAGKYTLLSEWLRVNGEAPDPQTYPAHAFFFWVMDGSIPAETGSQCLDLETGELPPLWKPVALSAPIEAKVMALNGCTTTESQALRIVKTTVSNSGEEGPVHWMILPGPLVDPGLAPIGKLSFDWAHHFVDSLGDIRLLLLSVPINACEAGIDTLWDVSNADLNTAVNPVTIPDANWRPLDCQDWKNQKIDLSGWIADKRQLVFAFGYSDTYVMPAYMDNICWTRQQNCLADLDIPRTAGTYTASYVCQENSWTHFVKAAGESPVSAKDQLLFSVKRPTGMPLNLPVEALTYVITDENGYDVSDSAPYVQNTMGFHAGGNYLQLDSTLDFGGTDFEVRFYFDQALPTGLAQQIGQPGLDPALLIPYATPLALDGKPENGQATIDSAAYQEFLPLAVDAHNGWRLEEKATFFQGTIALSELAFLGIGSGKEGRGFGARYPQPFQSFTAVQQGRDLALEWVSKRELLADYYEIIHSVDGKRFESLQTLSAKGKDTLLLHPEAYAFTANEVSFETHYYAVLLHHDNGYTLSSDTLLVDVDIRKLVKVYPNPLQQYLTIDPAFTWSESLELQLFDSQRKVFLRKEWNIPGEALQIEVPNIPPGIYFFQVESGELRIQGKLLKTP